MRIRFLIFCTLLISCLSAVAQVKETVVRDYFADNSSAWPEDVVRDQYSASIHDGSYYIRHDNASGSKVFDIPVKMMLNRNFFFEVTGKITGGEGGGLGLVWGKGGNGYLALVVTPDGRFFVRKVSSGAGGKYLLGPIKSKYVYPAHRENRLRVQYSGNEYMFFINGKYLGHIPSGDVFGTRAGVVLYGRMQAEVDYFGAYGTKSYQKLPGYNGIIKVPYYEIEDGTDNLGMRIGNGDCKVQPGETVELAVTLRNHGHGKCENLNVRFYSVSSNVSVENPDEHQVISSLDYMRSQVVRLKFKVDDHCTSEKINFKIDVTNQEGLMAETVNLSVPLYVRIPPINKAANQGASFTFNIREANADDINTFFPITNQNSQNTAALVIAVENYQHLPKAKYATNDARIVRQYLLKVCNLKYVNMVVASNQNATLANIRDLMRMGGELQVKRTTNAVDNLIVYFSGHGMCEPGRTEPYLMLYDSNPGNPSQTAYPLREFVKTLRGYFPGQVICIFETSFAGVDRDGRSFMQRGGSVWLNAAFPVVNDSNTCLLYASGDQHYNPVMEYTSHGMFTHFLLTALHDFGKNRNPLDMRLLFDCINKGMDSEASKNGIMVFPRMDCRNVDGIKLLK